MLLIFSVPAGTRRYFVPYSGTQGEQGLESAELNHSQKLRNVWAENFSGLAHAETRCCTVLAHYAALSGNSVPTFRDNLSVPSSRVKKSKDYHLPPCNISERISHLHCGGSIKSRILPSYSRFHWS
jgi:hypothetical protein